MRSVLLKADDFRLDRVTSAWKRFLVYCVQERLHCNVGVIARSSADLLPDRCDEIADELRQLGMGAAWSLWNHGLHHRRDREYGTSDFRGIPLARQVRFLRTAQDIVERVTGYRMTAFGAPFNWWDHNTILALQQVPEIRYVFHVPYVPDKICYGSELFVECEPFKGEVRRGAPRTFSIEQAKRQSERFLQIERSFVLQLHPNSWTADSLDAFAAFVQYVEEAGYRFSAVDDTAATLSQQSRRERRRFAV